MIIVFSFSVFERAF